MKKDPFYPDDYPDHHCKLPCFERLKPSIASVSATKENTRYHVDHWYCPECGLVYHFEEDEVIIEKRK